MGFPQVSKIVHAATLLLGVIVGSLVAAYFAQTYYTSCAKPVNVLVPEPVPAPEPTPAVIAINVTCTDGRIQASNCSTPNPCEVGYYIPIDALAQDERGPGACVHEQAVGGTTCDNKCYVANANSTTCDGAGGCTGDVTECGGYCTAAADCNATMPINADWVGVLSSPDFDSATRYVFWRYDYECYYNRCVLSMLVRYWGSNRTMDHQAAAALDTCNDFLNATFVADKGDCLQSEFFLLASNMTNASHYEGTTAYPSQYGMCTLWYDCATMNQTAMVAKRSTETEADGNAAAAIEMEEQFVMWLADHATTLFDTVA